MYNNYPSVFNKCNKVKISCDQTNKTCFNGSKNIKNQLNNLKIAEKNEKKKLKNMDKYLNSNCKNYNSSLEIINNNVIDFNFDENKSWSNQSGYGNIIIQSNDQCNNLNGRMHHWNRIFQLPKPYSTNVNTRMAWATY